MNFFRKFKYILITIAIVFGLAGAQLIIKSFAPENIYRKDFIQEYLLAKSIFVGCYPYLPLPELASKLGMVLPHAILPHPTPHPPSIALLSLPLALFGYERAALIWLLVEIICLFASVALLWKWWTGRIALPPVLLIAWTALGWGHVWTELVLGQVSTILLLLLAFAWQKLRDNDSPKADIAGQISGGMALGFAVALKFIGWPLVIFLILRRKWLSVISAAAAALILNLTAAAIMGWHSFLSYFTHVGPLLFSYYRAHGGNISLWGVGYRLFAGTTSPALISIESPPLIYVPALAKLISFALPLAVLIAGLRLALKTKNFDLSYGLMVIVSILISPIMWAHYIIMAAIPMLITIRALSQMNFPRRETIATAILALILLIPGSSLADVTKIFLIEERSDGSEVAPFAAGLISLIPTLSLLLLLWLMRRLSRIFSDPYTKPE